MRNLNKVPVWGGLVVLVVFLGLVLDSSFSVTNAQGGEDDAFLPFVARPGEVNTEFPVPVIHDAYVKSKYPQNNYGLENVLRIRNAEDNNNYASFLKFTVSGVNGSTTGAILRLYTTDGNNDGFAVYSVSNNYRNSNTAWTEGGLNWNNAPSMTGAPLAVVGAVSDNSWVEIDVTSAVNGNGTYSFALADLSQNSIYFNASEATTRQPVLMLQYAGPPGPAPTSTPLPTTTAVPPTPTAGPPPPTPPNPPPSSGGMWISSATIAGLPTTGPAWNNVLNAAQQNTIFPNISDQNDDTDVNVLAKALVFARTGQTQYRSEVIAAITAAIGTESGSGILAVGRNLQAYVIAADLIDLQSANPTVDIIFRQWLATIRNVVFNGAGPSLSIISCHESRPNNFGTHCGASRIAIALYLGDTADLQDAANVFKGWLGDRNAYAGFSYGDLDWQCNPAAPVGINPPGCTKNGHSIDGVLADDQRRSGGFTWPPPQENYVWEALQGAIVQAELLTRAGYPAWQWQSQALLRATTWLHQEANYQATGDDTWQPWFFNYVYGSNFPAPLPSNSGKGMGWTDWTHGN